MGLIWYRYLIYSVGLLCDIHNQNESNLDSINFVNVHLSVPLNSVSQTLHLIVFSSVIVLVNVIRAIIVILLISYSDIPSSVIKLPISILYLYYKRRILYLCSAKDPVLQGSQSRRVYRRKGTIVNRVYVCL